jgi:hypothetical protein
VSENGYTGFADEAKVRQVCYALVTRSEGSVSLRLYLHLIQSFGGAVSRGEMLTVDPKDLGFDSPHSPHAFFLYYFGAFTQPPQRSMAAMLYTS